MGAMLGVVLAALLQAPDLREVKGVRYFEGEGADNRKHRLDLYLPAGKEKAPVVMWIHGGAWAHGDKGLYGRLGRRFAREGIGLAAISYRLSPKVKHPAHIEDCARAFAWIHANVADHGGDPDRLFVMGHSAGGHLAALLALDRRYLGAHRVPVNAIKGVIPMSGVYSIPALPDDTKGFRAIFPRAFGSDPDACRAASPVTHASKLKAPMLVLTETDDNYRLRPTMRAFKAALEEAGAEGVTFADAEDRDHISIVVKMASDADDPQRKRIVEFIKSR